MDGGIYFEEDGELIEMTEHSYEYESVLQENLADFPRLLAGDQMTPGTPREWALVAREAAVPDREGGNERWSADHLFVDQDSVPTLVEVKRAQDTRIRREVVGQMFDYISHACIYWEADTLRQRFTETWESRGRTPDEILSELTDDSDFDKFWDRVEANLRSKRIRLLFVADEIPNELKRVIEFLNEELSSVEVFAIEVSQYRGSDRKAFVPRLYGQTEEARGKKSSTTRPNNTEDDLLADINEKLQNGDLKDEEANVIRDLYEFIKAEADNYDFGGSANVSVTARWDAIGGSDGMFTVNSKSNITFWQPEYNHRKQDADWERDALDQWYEDLANIAAPEIDPVENDTKFPAHVLSDDSKRDAFKTACLNFRDRIETT